MSETPSRRSQISPEAERKHLEAAERVKADVALALEESFTENAERVVTTDDGTDHLTLYIRPRESVLAQVDVSRGPVDDQGNRTTIMTMSPIARRVSRGDVSVANSTLHPNAWRFRESPDQPPEFENGGLGPDGSFIPSTDELARHPETVALFGAYWPANLREGSPENPFKSRTVRMLGRFGAHLALDKLQTLKHRNYYKPEE